MKADLPTPTSPSRRIFSSPMSSNESVLAVNLGVGRLAESASLAFAAKLDWYESCVVVRSTIDLRLSCASRRRNSGCIGDTGRKSAAFGKSPVIGCEVELGVCCSGFLLFAGGWGLLRCGCRLASKIGYAVIDG